MQGLWKDKRKHYIKDKSEAIYKRFVTGRYHNDYKQKNIEKQIYTYDVVTMVQKQNHKQTQEIKVYDIWVDGKGFQAYQPNNCGLKWYNIIDNKVIPFKQKTFWEQQNLGLKIGNYLYSFYEKLPITIIQDYQYYGWTFESKEKLYGKSFSYKDIRFDKGGYKKSICKMVNGKDRMLQNLYLYRIEQLGYENALLKTHGFSKSIKRY